MLDFIKDKNVKNLSNGVDIGVHPAIIVFVMMSSVISFEWSFVNWVSLKWVVNSLSGLADHRIFLMMRK